jgi:hypothetical protein
MLEPLGTAFGASFSSTPKSWAEGEPQLLSGRYNLTAPWELCKVEHGLPWHSKHANPEVS